MLPRSRPGRAAEDRRPRVCGVRTHWTTVADGEFHCPACGGDRNYQRRTGRRRLTLLGLPVLPRGEAGPVVECASCAGHFPTEVLARPTTTRFSALPPAASTRSGKSVTARRAARSLAPSSAPLRGV
ncbi:TerB family tellurite resistance protein, partial [Streptomyces albidoflavus]